MNSLEADREFFAQVNSVVGLPKYKPFLIEDANQSRVEQIGSAFVTRFDHSANPYDIDITIGIALPLDGSLTKHVVILISGEKMIIEPMDSDSVEKYKGYLNGNNPIRFEFTTDMAQIAAYAFDSRGLGSRVVMRNDTEANDVYINNLLPQAFDVAEHMRDQKRQDIAAY